MGRPRKAIEGEFEDIDGVEDIGKESTEPVADEIVKPEGDGKVSVMKNGVTRRIYPGQLDAWRMDGWR